MTGRWSSLPTGERRKIQMLIAFLVIAVYGLVIYPPTHRSFQEANNMLNRRRNRIETRANVDNLEDIWINPKVLETRIREAEERLEAMAETSDDLDSGFVAPDDSAAYQQLLLELTTLAERTGVEILSIVRKTNPPPAREPARRNTRGKVPVATANEPPPPIRPLLVVRTGAPFIDTLDFLRGMKDLSFYVCVMNLKIYSTFPAGERAVALPPGALYAVFEVSM